MSKTISVAEYIADFLVNNGIAHVFSVTGGGAMHLNNALGKHPGLEAVYNHHEQASAIAAESYARLTGKIAAVCVTTGPGGTNALTGVLGGYLDSIPMLILSGQVRYDTTVRFSGQKLRQLGDQEFDIAKTVRYMTKYAVMVTHPRSIRYHLERALYLALHGRPGPCWLDIPLDVQSAAVDPDTLLGYDPQEDAAEIPPPVTEKTAREILKKLAEAKRPVILVGSGIRLAGERETFLQLLDALRVPVVTAWNAHDVLYNDHPLYAGRPGSMGDRGGNYVIQNCDVLLTLGCRLNIRQISYNYHAFAPNAYHIMVDIDCEELCKPTLRVDKPVHADLRDFLPMLKAVLAGDQISAPENWMTYCREINKWYPVVLPEYRLKDTPVNPYCFMETLFHRLRQDEIVVCSNGSACVITFQAAYMKKETRMYANSGCASMGYGLPAAIGACFAARHRIICLEGDGSLQMNLQELQTVAYHHLPIKLIVLNNQGYHSIRQTQDNFFGRPLVGVGPDSGVGFVSFRKIAEAFSLPYYRVDSLAAAGDVVDTMLREDGPSFTEVILDPAQPFAPKMAAVKRPDGSLYTPPPEFMSPPLPEEEHVRNMEISSGQNQK